MGERVWEKFLTPQDRRHLALSRDRRIGFGEKPALVLIDLYRWVFGDKPQPLEEAIKAWPGSCGLAGWNALPHIQAVLEAAREAQIPIVHVTGIDHQKQFIPGWFERIRPSSRPTEKTPEQAERESRRWDIVDEVSPIPGEGVLRKAAPSAFWGTPLAAHLNALGVDTVLVVGESTSGCVRASVVEGATHSYRMIVVEEGVFDRHEATHAINLFDMNQKYADVTPLADVLEWLASWSREKQAVGSG